jgi:DNA ligase-associated metallophosphoesterase
MLIVTKNVQHLQLLSQKAIFWQEKQTLIISDLHLGKATHFQKAGVYVPITDFDDLQTLSQLINITCAKNLWIVGDLFHSKYNHSWDIFKNWCEEQQNTNNLSITLIKGNHDILPLKVYAAANIKVVQELVEPPFIFTHIPLTEIPEDFYNMSGHIHPAIKLKGSGKQQLTLPCFFFGEKQGYLPAFGSFTGVASLKPTDKDEVYMIVNQEVMKYKL